MPAIVQRCAFESFNLYNRQSCTRAQPAERLRLNRPPALDLRTCGLHCVVAHEEKILTSDLQ